MAQLLDHLDSAPRGADAAQYRAVAMLLSDLLLQLDEDVLALLLPLSPAARELYENLHYSHAGLCKSELDLALRAELAAQEALRKAAQLTT